MWRKECGEGGVKRGEWRRGSGGRESVEKVEKESEAEANGMHHVQHVQNICTKAKHTLQLYHKET